MHDGLLCPAPRFRSPISSAPIRRFASTWGSSGRCWSSRSPRGRRRRRSTGVLANAKLPASSWHRASFARDLYLDELVDKCFEVRVDGVRYAACARYLGRVVARAAARRPRRRAPPRGAPRARRVGRDAPPARARVRRDRPPADAAVRARQPSPRGRRIEILRGAREAFDLLAARLRGGDLGARSAARVRRRRRGRAKGTGGSSRCSSTKRTSRRSTFTSASGPTARFARCRSWAYARTATIRSMPRVLRRLVVRLILFFRGYRTTSGEVAERVLSDVLTGVEDEVGICFQLLGDLEVHLGALGFRDRAAAAGLPMALPELAAAGRAAGDRGALQPAAAGVGRHAGRRAISARAAARSSS